VTHTVTSSSFYFLRTSGTHKAIGNSNILEEFIFWELTPCSPLKVKTGVSEEHIAFFFRVKNKASKKPA
jgi:hypothetical protein